MKKIVLPALMLICGQWASAMPNDNGNLKLWYNRPASSASEDRPMSDKYNEPDWLKALPVGNGYMGAMIYGDVYTERLQLNNKTLWSGGCCDSDNPDAYQALERIRQLLAEGRYKEAYGLTLRNFKCKGKGSGGGSAAITDAPYGTYQTLGDLWIRFDSVAPYTDYRRDLDLSEATAHVSYGQKDNVITREYFASYPDNVIVVKIKSSKKGGVNFSVSLDRPERYHTTTDGTLVMSGTLDDYQGGRGMKYVARVAVRTKGGAVTSSASASMVDGKSVTSAGIRVSGADEAELYITSATDYRQEYQNYLDPEFRDPTAGILSAAMSKSYDELKDRHIADYKNLFNRVQLALNDSGKDPNATPTDQRLQEYKSGAPDAYLQTLYFQFGRYLLIASSRPGSLPANLQGVWSNKLQTPWNGDYHANINVQMNYWPAEVTGLAELHLPFLELIASLVKPGSRTAEVHYHASGWVMHPITNVWGYTSPGEGGLWGIHIGAAGWVCQHIWEHYAFTGDREFLRQYYPVMESASRFYLDWLVRDPQTGKWVSGPSASPENAFVAPDGSTVAICMGPSHDHQIIGELFGNTLKAAQVLGIDDECTKRIGEKLSDLSPMQIGSDGRIMEWDKEYKEAEPGHRHLSHLYALYPGYAITPHTPELLDAAGRSLDMRLANGGGHTGWSMAWIANLRARLGQGDQALEAIDALLKKCTAPNLFDLHPPFQIDGNFGATAAFAEMLVQSHDDGIVDILPALPSGWSSGQVRGLKTRGGHTIDIEWDHNGLAKLQITAGYAPHITVRYHGDIIIDKPCAPGSVIEVATHAPAG